MYSIYITYVVMKFCTPLGNKISVYGTMGYQLWHMLEIR